MLRSGSREPEIEARIRELVASTTAAVKQLPDSEPRILEALCLAGNQSLVPMPERAALWKRAVAIASTTPPPDVKARYASLARATVRVGFAYEYALYTFSGSPIGSKPELSGGSTMLPTTQDDECLRIDLAFLKMQLIESWHGTGMGVAMVSPTGSGGAVSERMYASAAAMFAALYDEAARDLGPEDPLLATLLDFGLAYCDRKTRASHARSACPPERKALERALALREKGFGADHPLTNASRLNLGQTLLAGRDTRRAETLIAAAAATRPGDRYTVEALRTLAGIQFMRGEKVEAEASAAEAARIARVVYDPKRDWFDLPLTLVYHARLAAACGFFDKSEAAYKLADKDGSYAYELAEVYMAAGRGDEALATYNRDIEALRAANPQGVDIAVAPGIARSMRGRIAILTRMGRTAAAAADREYLETLQPLLR